MVKVKPVQNGRTTRMSFSRINEVIGMPNLIEIQKNSYNWFLEEGLHESFTTLPRSRTTPAIWCWSLSITGWTRTPSILSRNAKSGMPHMRHPVCHGSPAEQADRRGAEQEIFMGDFPLMTESGTFVINGAERVVVSQLVRSPGIYYGKEIDSRPTSRC